MTQWQPIGTLNNDDNVLLGKWYEDDCRGYHGESRWLWIASGNLFPDGSVWIDFTDTDYAGVFYQEPTHWCALPTDRP